MAEFCPHCGAPLTAVRDAFCSECRAPLNEVPYTQGSTLSPMVRIRLERGRHAAEYFTIPGRILVLTAIVLAVGGPWVVVAWLNKSLPPGSYPLWFFALPIWVGTALLFILVAGVFKWLKVPIFRQPPHPGDLGGDESKPYAADGADTRPD